jgi:predicted O-methyltransferase YrrM
MRALPARVALFQARAVALAIRHGDTFSLRSAAQPRQIAELIRLASGRRHVVELGTATGWTAAALTLSDPARRVVSCDPNVQPQRERYLGLLPSSARERLTLLQVEGASAARLTPDPVDMLFIDSSHEKQATIDEWNAWRPRLASQAVVVLHDFTHPEFPGVAAAVRELGLSGQVREGMFVWSAP